MGLRFSVLASGSTGNATIIQNKHTTLLLDAGLSAKRLEQISKEMDILPTQINGILVTHEHSDHIKGLGAFSRKHDLPIYANEKTWEAIEGQIGEIATKNIHVFPTDTQHEIGDIQVESFGISHDAAEPVGYNFYDQHIKLSIATDLGYVSEKVKQAIANAHVLVLEANHDVGMLRMGRYPWNIKRRILGDQGHLSNESAGDALFELIGNLTRRVYLAHLSRDHNMLDLATMTVEQLLSEKGVNLLQERLSIKGTYYNQSTMWDEVGKEFL